jgi:hypothetical protein
MVPFCGRNVANLSPEQAAFKTALSKQRVKVEQLLYFKVEQLLLV